MYTAISDLVYFIKFWFKAERRDRCHRMAGLVLRQLRHNGVRISGVLRHRHHCHHCAKETLWSCKWDGWQCSVCRVFATGL